MPVPYTFANQIGNIALSELDANFANVKAAADTAATVTASAQPAITSVGQLTSLGVLGNISSLIGGVYAPGFYYPNGVSILTGISSGSSSYGNSNVAAYLPGYDGGLVSLTGNVTTTADINARNGVFSSTVTAGGNITTSANIYASRNITGQTLTSQGSITGTTVTATSGNITATGGDVVGSNVRASGNVVASSWILGNAILSLSTVQGTDLYSTGLIRGSYATLSGNLSVATYANVGADVNATGNISATYFIGNGALLTGITASGDVVSSVAADKITGNVLSGNVISSYLTSVGNLTSLNVDTTITAQGNVSAPYFVGNGSLLTGISTTGSTAASALTGSSLSSNVVNSSLTTVGTLSSLAVSGTSSFTGTLTAGTISASNVSATTLNGTTITGTLSSSTQLGITQLGTLNSLTVAGSVGNITANNISANSVTSTSSGVPTITSSTSIILSAPVTTQVQGGGTFRLPSMTTAQRDALVAVNGDMIYNTSLSKIQGYQGGAWVNLA